MGISNQMLVLLQYTSAFYLLVNYDLIESFFRELKSPLVREGKEQLKWFYCRFIKTKCIFKLCIHQAVIKTHAPFSSSSIASCKEPSSPIPVFLHGCQLLLWRTTTSGLPIQEWVLALLLLLSSRWINLCFQIMTQIQVNSILASDRTLRRKKSKKDDFLEHQRILQQVLAANPCDKGNANGKPPSPKPNSDILIIFKGLLEILTNCKENIEVCCTPLTGSSSKNLSGWEMAEWKSTM